MYHNINDNSQRHKVKGTSVVYNQTVCSRCQQRSSNVFDKRLLHLKPYNGVSAFYGCLYKISTGTASWVKKKL